MPIYSDLSVKSGDFAILVYQRPEVTSNRNNKGHMMMGVWMCSKNFQTNLVAPDLLGFAQSDDGAKFARTGFAGDGNKCMEVS